MRDRRLKRGESMTMSTGRMAHLGKFNATGIYGASGQNRAAGRVKFPSLCGLVSEEVSKKSSAQVKSCLGMGQRQEAEILLLPRVSLKGARTPPRCVNSATLSRV